MSVPGRPALQTSKSVGSENRPPIPQKEWSLVTFVWNRDCGTHFGAVLELLRGAQQIIRIVCPFIRKRACEELVDGNVFHEGISVRVLTQWAPAAFIRGVSELQALELLQRLGAQVRARASDLHAKVYIADSLEGLVTSANITHAGLHTNVECGIVTRGPDVELLVAQFDREWRLATEITEGDIIEAKRSLAQHSRRARALQKELNKLESGFARSVRVVRKRSYSNGGALVIELTPDERECILRPVHGRGGMQSLLRRLQENLRGHDLSLTPEDCERVVRYANTYGQGGFQNRLKPLAADIAACIE